MPALLLLPPLLLYIIINTGVYHKIGIVQRFWIVVGVGVCEMILFYLVIKNIWEI
jgi:hypothetical protein